MVNSPSTREENENELFSRGNFFRIAQLKIAKLEDEDMKEIYTRGLRRSACFDGNGNDAYCDLSDPLRLPSPSEISGLCAATPEQLNKDYMCLTRKEAVLYLRYKGIDVTEKEFEFQTKARLFKTIFGREPARLPNGAYLFTYGEIQKAGGSEFPIRWN
jgi:hypothetical protein